VLVQIGEAAAVQAGEVSHLLSRLGKREAAVAPCIVGPRGRRRRSASG
jgi:hypothetical protein